MNIEHEISLNMISEQVTKVLNDPRPKYPKDDYLDILESRRFEAVGRVSREISYLMKIKGSLHVLGLQIENGRNDEGKI